MLDLAASLGWHAGPVTCACVCMASGSAATGGADGKVLVWDIRRKVGGNPAMSPDVLTALLSYVFVFRFLWPPKYLPGNLSGPNCDHGDVLFDKGGGFAGEV